MGGYARGHTQDGRPRNYADEQRRALLKQAKLLEGVVITNYSYEDMLVPPNSIIYCDPPYYNTTQGYEGGAFNSNKFWAWAEEKGQEGHAVYVSEYTCFSDKFAEVWSKNRSDSLTKNTGAKRSIERLYKYCN